MCIKNSPPDMKTRSMTKKDKAKESLKKPARRTRTKTRKPKFLSLRRELSSETSHTNSTQMTQMTQNHKNQLNLFPLHPENLVEDKDIHDENVAFLFNSEAGSGSASLNFLIVSTSSEVQDSRSPFCYGGQDSEEAGCANNNSDHGDHCNSASSKLLKTAMRIKERDPSTEKWVCYSEVVEKKELEEVTSCSAADTWCTKRTQGLLSLKLDYQEIMNAWSHKGPLYIEGESPPQTVPDLHDDHGANVLVDGWGSVGNVWRVPEMGSSDDIGNSIKVKEEFEGNDGWKMRHREASVLRYKEKRQNRLFSKRIRYEVRKLNAEKRPRMKQIRERGLELNSQHRRDQICH